MRYNIIFKDRGNWVNTGKIDGKNIWRYWNGHNYWYLVEQICTYCGNKCLQSKSSYGKQPYCNNRCSKTGKTNRGRIGQYKSEEERKKISLGHGGTGVPRELSYIYTQWTNKLKEHIRKRDNYTCQKCDMTQEEHFVIYGRDLDVHHIDSIKDNCENNNLITLCRSCHARTKFNRIYWENYFKEKMGEKIPRS